MPALAIPRFIPHGERGTRARAGVFSTSAPRTALGFHAGSPDELAHDARNIISGLMLYCELLAAPGVLSQSHSHYAQDLETIAQSAAQIIERLAAAQKSNSSPDLPAASPVPLASVPVTDIADQLRHLQPLVAAIAGPAIRLSISTMPCAGRTALAIEDLTRILINLVRNAADAMPSGGNVRITAQYGDGLSFLESPLFESPDAFAPARNIVLTVTDNGPGIPESLRDRIFDLGFSTRSTTPSDQGNWPSPPRRGIGLSIVRNLVEAAGGRVHATCAPGGGARFEIALPFLRDSITSGTCSRPPHSAFPADSHTAGCIELH
jgi:two-component system cell cycle sensor histidine kinase/response regulator CckA